MDVRHTFYNDFLKGKKIFYKIYTLKQEQRVETVRSKGFYEKPKPKEK
jgi:hypothetical protein